MTTKAKAIINRKPTITVADIPHKQDPYDRIPFAGTEELIEIMERESEQSERARLLDEMTPACRAKVEFIDTWLRNEIGLTMRRRYDLGLQILELYRDETSNGAKVYGRRAIDRICKVLNWDDGVIRLSLKFVQRFTPEDLDKLCTTPFPNGEPITWSHVRCLLTVEDLPSRQALLDRTVTEGWTCTDLAQAVKTLSSRPEDGRGRPPKTPQSFDDFVANQMHAAEQWEKSYGRLYGNPKFSLATHAATLTPEQVTNERLREATDLAMLLRRVADQALKQAAIVERVIHDLGTAL